MYGSSVTHSSQLLDYLGSELGLTLEFDEQGQCLLVLDGNLMISVRQAEDSWILYGMLGEFYPHPDVAFFHYLLSLNQSLAEQGRGALAFDRQNNAVLYLQHLSLKDASCHSVYQALEVFTDGLEELVQRFNTSEAGAARIQGPVFQLQRQTMSGSL